MNGRDTDTPPQYFVGGLVRQFAFTAFWYTGREWSAIGSDDNAAVLRRRCPGAVVLPCGQLPTSEHLAEQRRETS